MPTQSTWQRLDERERVRVAEVEARETFGDDDRVLPVGREVHVVRVLDRDRRTRPPGDGIDRRERVAAVVRDVERLQVPRRARRAGAATPTAKWSMTCAVFGIDDVDGVAQRVRHVHARRIVLHDAATARSDGRPRRCRPAGRPEDRRSTDDVRAGARVDVVVVTTGPDVALFLVLPAHADTVSTAAKNALDTARPRITARS